VARTESPPSQERSRCLALVGNPNSGKTTLFNSLTGANFKVANYPGVTVEKKEGSITLTPNLAATIIDLPGTYALSGATLDETIVTKFLSGELKGSTPPDLIVAVVDATNLERNLFIVSELIDIGLPIVIALNMMDSVEQQGLKIYADLLGRILDLPIVPIVARSKKGVSDLQQTITRELLHPTRSRKAFAWVPSEHTRAEQLRAQANPLTMSNLEPPVVTSIATLRYAWIRSIVSRVVVGKATAPAPVSRLDSVLTSKIWGLPILIAVFTLMFQSIFLWAQAPMELISSTIDSLSAFVGKNLPSGMLTRLLTEGIIPGVGNVLVFIPQIAILFFCIGVLEESGYLSRAAFLLDNFMRKVGLQGRAFIPLLSSFACAVPGILSTRTIPSRADRLTTIMIAPLMSCSARLPVYAVLIGATIPPTALWGIVSIQGLALLSMYVFGIVMACLVAVILQRVLRKQESCFFVMEIPPLRMPSLRTVIRNVYEAVFSFIKNASTIILACSVVLWFLVSYPAPKEDTTSNSVEASYAGQLGKFIEPAIRPLGFNWEIGFSIIASFPAREVFVTSLATILNVQDSEETENRSLISKLQSKKADGSFTLLTAVSLMVFYALACQCMSTLAVCRRETGSWMWTVGMFTYMTALAYIASLITYQVGSRIF
jgi:ferrous iron transport protein B